MGSAVAMTIISTAVSTIQKQAQAKAQRRAQQATTNQQIAQRQQQQQIREKQQRDQQKQAQATARASFGARGVTSAGGSANAVVDGIRARTDEKISDDRQVSDFGIEALRENQRQRSRQSVLESRNSIMNTVVGTAGKLFS